jgi:hypothetical protein
MKPLDIEVGYNGDRLEAYIPVSDSNGRIIKHDPRLWPELDRVREHTTIVQDLRILDDLFGRDNLPADATPVDVKKEAIRQLIVEFEI